MGIVGKWPLKLVAPPIFRHAHSPRSRLGLLYTWATIDCGLPKVKRTNSMSDIVYKFLPAAHALTVMEEKKLKVSMIPELNDLYDCAPIVGPNEDETRRTIEHIHRSYGLICFSRTAASPVLWGHYASSATGIALGFDPARFGFRPGWLRFEVSYDRERPIIKWPPDPPFTPELQLDAIGKSFGIKAEEWRYEKEHRCVLRLDICEPRRGMYFAEFHPGALREVILGCRSTIDPSYLLRFLRKHYESVGVILRIAKEHPTHYEVMLEPFQSLPPEPSASSEPPDSP